jgi:hypothetical protein
VDPLYDKLTQLHITEADTEDVLKLLDTEKATGPYLINPRLLRKWASISKLPLCRLLNLSLSICRFPTQWRLANVTPVFKTDNYSKVKYFQNICPGQGNGKKVFIHKFIIFYSKIVLLPHTNQGSLLVILQLTNF